ncbi:hypothetical protein [Amycolatopsis sp. cmx-4-54]|uniref:hypothetical protein n=1 Tax=Amycolatopsis sp. cmx-4-54 TaxID=2790936 RepID=UPI00397CDBE7
MSKCNTAGTRPATGSPITGERSPGGVTHGGRDGYRNLAGYQHGHSTSGRGNRHTFGGLTDQAFRMIPLLDAGRSADWPF